MTNQEIFETLANREMETFYLYCQESTEENKLAHELAKQNLLDFAKRTGCCN